MYFKSEFSKKKTVALSFLFLANAILLAHIAIPHHHHEGEESICLFDTHCQDSKEAHKHEQHGTHEREGNPSDRKCCIIDNAYTLANNNVKTTCHIHKNCNCGQTLYTLISNSLNTQDFVNYKVIHFRQKPYVPLFYIEFISQSNGLRAPPAC